MERYIAMWSGPRNISTAMMRAWGNRPDTVVCDEPLYAHYLAATGHTDHPGYEETVRKHETDWRKVVRTLTGPIPSGKAIYYQKHMAHHMLPGMDIDWIAKLSNCFLIREPHEMLLSLIEFLPSPTIAETGLPQQVTLFDFVAERCGAVPPVVDAKDVLTDTPGMLRALCARLHVPFSDEMLAWPAGPRDTDGAWAPHWYAKVYESTAFAPYRSRQGQLPEHLHSTLAECQELYQRLYRYRLRPESPQERRTNSSGRGSSNHAATIR
jgi:hypothetical protein